MLKRYESFLESFDKKLEEYFNNQNQYIKCKNGCSLCCEIGEYPFSRLEAEYIMNAFVKLDKATKDKIRQNIFELKTAKSEFKGERFLYKCPFLIDKKCSLYKSRGIVCRVHGLAYLNNGIVNLPECTNLGLNYSGCFNSQTKEVKIENLIEKNLNTDKILRSKLATEDYELECGEIRPLIDWFNVDI